MNNSSDLLNQLRIDRAAAPPPRPSGRGPWLAIAGAGVLLAAAGAWWLLRGSRWR
jgi:hypothetical protein